MAGVQVVPFTGCKWVSGVVDTFRYPVSVRASPFEPKAFVHLARGDVDEGRLEVDEGLALDPDSLFFLDAVGYLLTLLGDWERGPELSRRAVRLNPRHRDVAHADLMPLLRQE